MKGEWWAGMALFMIGNLLLHDMSDRDSFGILFTAQGVALMFCVDKANRP